MSSEHNPYAAPVSDTAPAREMAPMFGYVGILLAGIFGILVGGAIVMALNFRAMGRPGAAIATPVIAIGVLVLYGWAITRLEVSPALVRWPLMVSWLVTILALTRWWQGGAIAARRSAGIRQRPWWLALGIGLLLNVALFALFALVSLVPINVTLQAP